MIGKRRHDEVRETLDKLARAPTRPVFPLPPDLAEKIKPLTRLANALLYIRNGVGLLDFPCQQLLILLLLYKAGLDGLLSTELGERLKIGHTNISKNLRILSVWQDSPGGPIFGYGFVELRQDIVNRRKTRARLTARGNQLVNIIGQIIGEDD